VVLSRCAAVCSIEQMSLLRPSDIGRPARSMRQRRHHLVEPHVTGILDETASQSE